MPISLETYHDLAESLLKPAPELTRYFWEVTQKVTEISAEGSREDDKSQAIDALVDQMLTQAYALILRALNRVEVLGTLAKQGYRTEIITELRALDDKGEKARADLALWLWQASDNIKPPAPTKASETSIPGVPYLRLVKGERRPRTVPWLRKKHT